MKDSSNIEREEILSWRDYKHNKIKKFVEKMPIGMINCFGKRQTNQMEKIKSATTIAVRNHTSNI